MAVVTHLYRYPIKGLSPEPLTGMELNSRDGLPFDREFALALGTTLFSAEAPEPLDKGFFLMLRRNEELAALTTALDPRTSVLSVRLKGELLLEADIASDGGRAEVEEFFARYVGEAARGRPRLVSAKGHKFTDASVISPVMMRAVSLINLETVRAVEARLGRPVNALRFRGNIHVDGVPAWREMDWLDREIRIGPVTFRGRMRTPRCGAVNVNPDTAERDANLPKDLLRNFGHADLGIYLEVVTDGRLQIGDAVHAA
ncbi:MOSC domain-containing protein [Azospirillum sp. SYSU D00513]|uniref:MOSC domain-containing protein n=1 Tax=Azospirillum sp. SYSU D00513 TaxID=2812561 RepID=UPI001A972394|nr:MOSC domain-containing protein [Azospirillum sp. SYSU D00513]